MDVQLKKGLLEICVLAVIDEEPSYGYKIINSLADIIDISESTLYTILKRLESGNFLKTKTREENGRLRKYYIITPSGRAKIDDFVQCGDEFNRIISFIEKRSKHGNEIPVDERI